MDVIHPIHGIGKPFRWRKTQHGFNLWADVVPGAVGAEFGNVGNGGEALHQSAIPGFRGPKLSLCPLLFDRNARQMSGVRDELQMLRDRSTRLPIIDRERSEDRAVLRSNRRGPAST